MAHLRSTRVRAVISWGFAAVFVASACVLDLAGGRGLAAEEADNPLAAVAAALGDPVAVTAVIQPGDAGKPDILAVTAKLEDGWHL